MPLYEGLCVKIKINICISVNFKLKAWLIFHVALSKCIWMIIFCYV